MDRCALHCAGETDVGTGAERSAPAGAARGETQLRGAQVTDGSDVSQVRVQRKQKRWLGSPVSPSPILSFSLASAGTGEKGADVLWAPVPADISKS